jgi:hypothetical protein
LAIGSASGVGAAAIGSFFSSAGAFSLGGFAATFSGAGSGFLNFFKASANCAFLTVILRFLANF